MTCVDCHSTNAELFRGDDGRHQKQCHDCGHVWGPFTSSTTMKRRESAPTSQPDGDDASLSTFAEGDQ